MALIGTIRKNFWFVLILLGFALAAFIIMDMTSAGNAGGAATSLSMAEVGDETIDYREFQQTEQSYYSSNGQDIFAKRKTIWDFYVEKAVLQSEADALGLHISRDELMELQFGTNPSPVISANWRNPQTGQLDFASLNQIKNSLENNDPMDPRFRSYWAEQEKQIIKESLQSKLNGLISKSIYTPVWMAEESYAIENSKADFNYVKIPFDEIDGTGVELSDSDFTSYINDHKSEFETNEETRNMEFAVFDVVPNAEDSLKIKIRLDGLNNEFAITDNDSIFATVNNGSYTHLYSELDVLPADLQEGIAALQPGDILGPVVSNGYYLSAKLIDKKVIPDSVSARHILIRGDKANPTSMASAHTLIDSIEREYRSGRESFDSLAIKHSADTQSAVQGGDLGIFPQEKMVPEFTKACFANGKRGGLYTVETQFGVHLIRVDKLVFNDRDPKYQVASIGLVIKPSQETQDSKYDEVTELASQAKDIESLKTAINDLDGVDLESSEGLVINDYSVGTLGSNQSSREMIKWAFDSSTEVGDVSPEVYRYTDPVNYYDNKYVIASLSDIIKAGLPSVDAVRSQIETAVMNIKKGEQLKSSITINSLEDLASQYSVEVESASDIAMNNRFIPGIGNEPDVVGAAFRLAPQSVSEAIVGNSGVYIIQPLSQQEAGVPSNIPFLKTTVSTATKSQVVFRVINNMKKRAKIKDDRNKFF